MKSHHSELPKGQELWQLPGETIKYVVEAIGNDKILFVFESGRYAIFVATQSYDYNEIDTGNLYVSDFSKDVLIESGVLTEQWFKDEKEYQDRISLEERKIYEEKERQYYERLKLKYEGKV